MTLCVVDQRPCRCQPEDGVPCPGVVELRKEVWMAHALNRQHLFEVRCPCEICVRYKDDQIDGLLKELGRPDQL